MGRNKKNCQEMKLGFNLWQSDEYLENIKQLYLCCFVTGVRENAADKSVIL